jgi:hypothetical protein
VQNLHRIMLARKEEWDQATEEYERVARSFVATRRGTPRIRCRHLFERLDGRLSRERRSCRCRDCQQREEVQRLGRESDECFLRYADAWARYYRACDQEREGSMGLGTLRLTHEGLH